MDNEHALMSLIDLVGLYILSDDICCKTEYILEADKCLEQLLINHRNNVNVLRVFLANHLHAEIFCGEECDSNLIKNVICKMVEVKFSPTIIDRL